MELGFTFFPPPYPNALGHPQLDINLYDTPTGLHFDPQRVIALIYDWQTGLARQIFEHPVLAGERKVAAGRVTISDHQGKEFEVFTFGGRLELSLSEVQSACRLESTAPIFDLRPVDPFEIDLVCEFEGELARARAVWRDNHPDFDEWLAEVEPRKLFLAVAASTQERLTTLAEHTQSEAYWLLLRELTRALKFLDPGGCLPLGTQTLSKLVEFANN